MKHVFVILTAVLATFVLGVTATPASAYPPATPLLTTPTPACTAGASLTLTATGFVAGAVVTFSIGGVAVGTAVANASGVATLVTTCPTTPGTVTVTASSPDGRSATFVLTASAAPVPTTVPPAAAPLPRTGTDSGNTTMTAGVLVLIGAGLVGAAALRRRSRAITT